MPVDESVAKMVFDAKRMERALNDPGPWFIRFKDIDGTHWSDVATREITEDKIIFRVVVPRQGNGEAILECNMVTMGVSTDLSAMKGDVIEWVFQPRISQTIR